MQSFHTSNDRLQSCVCDHMKDENSGWHAGQSVLTLQVNRWKALEETTVSFKNKKKRVKALTGLVLLEQACRMAKYTLK